MSNYFVAKAGWQLGLAAIFWTADTPAQTSNPEGRPPARQTGQHDFAGYQLNLDNDFFVPGSTDRWYTNGLRLAWTYKTPSNNPWVQGVLASARDWDLIDAEPTLTYSVGQSMYSPRAVSVATAQPLDRPWGGFLYGGITAQAYKGPRFAATEIKVGVTGPLALAAPLQSAWHNLIGSPQPVGWSQQLAGRPALQISHTRQYRHPNFSGDQLAFQTGWGGAVGNLRVYGNVNASLIWGDLQGSATPTLIANEGDFVVLDLEDRAMFKRPFGYFSVGMNLVAYNYFITGPTPYGNTELRTNPVFGTAQIGISLPTQQWLGKQAPRLVYALNIRSAEFRSVGLEQMGGVQRWGSLTLNWDLR